LNNLPSSSSLLNERKAKEKKKKAAHDIDIIWVIKQPSRLAYL
jgi:hypothetical protein